MRKILFATIAACAITGAAMADDLAYTKGVGVDDCPYFLKTLSESPEAAKLIYSQWFYGLASGMNTMNVSQKKPFRDLRQINDETVTNAIGGYCAAHPDDSLSDAAVTYWMSLPKVSL